MAVLQHVHHEECDPLYLTQSCACADVSAPAAAVSGHVPDALVNLAIRPLDIGQTPAGSTTPAPMPPALKELAGTGKQAGFGHLFFTCMFLGLHADKYSAGSSGGSPLGRYSRATAHADAKACIVMHHRSCF